VVAGTVPVGSPGAAACHGGHRQRVSGRPMLFMKAEAGPSEPARPRSSTRTPKMSLSPLRRGPLNSTTAFRCRVAILAQDRHRGVRRILGEAALRRSKSASGPCRLALCEFMTIGDGSLASFFAPCAASFAAIGVCGWPVASVWADARPAIQTRAAAVIEKQRQQLSQTA
jgi:hypothetical protein